MTCLLYSKVVGKFTSAWSFTNINIVNKGQTKYGILRVVVLWVLCMAWWTSSLLPFLDCQPIHAHLKHMSPDTSANDMICLPF